MEHCFKLWLKNAFHKIYRLKHLIFVGGAGPSLMLTGSLEVWYTGFSSLRLLLVWAQARENAGFRSCGTQA